MPTVDRTPAAPDGALATRVRHRVHEDIAGLLGLSTDAVPMDASLQALGFDSLTAIQLRNRVRAAFGVNLPLPPLFEAPTTDSVAAHVMRVLAGMDATPEPRPSIGRESHDAAAPPLSFAQQRVWLLDQLSPGTGLYTVVIRTRIEGPLQPALLEASFRELIQRHDILRATFSVAQGRPTQRILERQAFDLVRLDVTGVEGQALDERLAVLTREASRQPFDLSTGPLLRGWLAALPDGAHLLLMTVHHIVFDGWSLGVLMREVGAIYAARVRHESPRLDPLPMQFGDFAHWQRQSLDAEVLALDLAYWRARLAGSQVPRLPTDRPSRPRARGRSRRVTATVPRELLGRLRLLGQQHQATLFMTLMAALQLLLMRYSRREDIIVGFPVAGRTLHETHGLIGFFANTLVLRGDLSGDPPFTELLAQIRRHAIGAYVHDGVPYERLVEEVQPAREGTRAPLFNVWCVLETPTPVVEFAGLRWSFIDVDNMTSRFDLLLRIVEEPDALAIAWMFDADLFDDETVATVSRRFGQTLESITADPSARLSAIEIFTPDERVQQSASAAAAQAERRRARHERFNRIRAGYGHQPS
jgi:acyl carrier protein